MSNNVLSPTKTNIIKIVAIILMFCHHFFNDSWILEGNMYISVLSVGRISLEMFLGDVGKICVSIFAFLTGYGMYFSFSKCDSFTKLLKRIGKFLLKFWFILFSVFIPCYYLTGRKILATQIGLAMFGLESSVNMFSWYVNYYILSVILLWIWYKILKNNLWMHRISKGLAICLLLLPFVQLNNSVVQNLCMYYPATIAGYMIAQESFFDKISIWLDSKLSGKWQVVLGFMGGGIALVSRYIISMLTHWQIWTELDTLFAFLIVLSCILITKNLKINSDNQISIMGKATTSMWFLHAIFFGTYTSYVQWIAYLPKYSLLIICWVTVILGLASILVDFLWKIVVEFISNKLHIGC